MKESFKILILIIISWIWTGTFNLCNGQDQKKWQWVKQLGGKSWDMTSGVVCDTKNNLYVAGSFSDILYCDKEKIKSTGNQDAFIAQFNENGSIEHLWRGGGRGRDQATCITTSFDNNVIIGGTISDTVEFADLINVGKGNRLFVTSLSAKGKFTWISTISPSEKASLFSIKTDNDGNIYASGSFTGTLSSGDLNISSTGKKDIFLAKFGKTGNIEMMKAFGGDEDDSPTALEVTDSGEVVIAGIIGNTFSINDHTLESHKNNSNSNVFILQLDNEFNARWHNIISAKEYVHIASLQHDSHGNIYASGSFNMTMFISDTTLISNGYTDGYLLKYSQTGKLLWCRNFGTWYYDYANNLIIDNLDGSLITGSIGDTIVIDSISIYPNIGKNSAFALQLSPDGKAIWADCISGEGRNFSNASLIDHDGNLYLAGAFQNKFEKESTNLSSRGDHDIFLAMYSNCLTHHAEITGNTILCPGSTTELRIKKGYRDVTWNDSIKNQNYMTVRQPGNYNVTMIDRLGCVLTDSVEVIMAANSDFSIGNDTQIPVDSTLLLKAPYAFNNLLWQDDSNNPTFLAKAENREAGTYTFWLSAIDSLGCFVSDTISLLFYATPHWVDINSAKLVIYPNPLRDHLNWFLNVEDNCRLTVDITDENGKTVFIKHFENYQSKEINQIDFGDLPYGLYYFHLRDGEGQLSPGVSIIKQ